MMKDIFLNPFDRLRQPVSDLCECIRINLDFAFKFYENHLLSL